MIDILKQTKAAAEVVTSLSASPSLGRSCERLGMHCINRLRRCDLGGAARGEAMIRGSWPSVRAVKCWCVTVSNKCVNRSRVYGLLMASVALSIVLSTRPGYARR
jgi:hypothetical protein